MIRTSIVLFFLLTSGCMSIPDRIDSGWSHISHPTQGWPFGPSTEEDSLNTLDVRATWDIGRCSMEMGLGKKIGDGGFYGNDLIFTSRMSVSIWSK